MNATLATTEAERPVQTSWHQRSQQSHWVHDIFLPLGLLQKGMSHSVGMGIIAVAVQQQSSTANQSGPVTLPLDLLTLKVVSSHVMYATDRQTDVRCASCK